MTIKPYYKKNGIIIFHGDCLEILPLLIAERNLKVDHVITDPPYESEAHNKQRIAKDKKVSSKPLDFQPITESQRLALGALVGMITKRWALTFCQIEASQKWVSAYSENMRYLRSCIWIKPMAQPQYTGDRPGMGYETIVAMHSQAKSRWNGGGRRGVFDSSALENKSNPHQTTKPLTLMRELIRLFTDSNEIILDPFCGSGSTLRAAKDLGRRAIGIEIEEKWCELAANRCEQVGANRFRNTNGRMDSLIERGYERLL